MKPSWDEAPEFAKWLAMDQDGHWYWYANKPNRWDDGWSSHGRSEFAGDLGIDWRTSTEKRPCSQPPSP